MDISQLIAYIKDMLQDKQYLYVHGNYNAVLHQHICNGISTIRNPGCTSLVHTWGTFIFNKQSAFKLCNFLITRRFSMEQYEYTPQEKYIKLHYLPIPNIFAFNLDDIEYKENAVEQYYLKQYDSRFSGMDLAGSRANMLLTNTDMYLFTHLHNQELQELFV